MKLRDYRLWFAWLVLAALLAAFVHQLVGYRRDARYNDAVRERDLLTAAAHTSSRGTLAGAIHRQFDGDIPGALAGYAKLDLAADSELVDTRRYNLGLIWLAQAVEQEAAGEPELGVPLVELAKQAWRDVLRKDPDAYDARHNLAQALQMLPEIAAIDANEENMPERSPRAPQATRAIDRLP